MTCTKFGTWLFLALLLGSADVSAGRLSAFNKGGGQLAPANVEFIAAEDLKAKINRSERVTIIDVRSNESYSDSAKTIKTSIHFNPRKLNSRLGFPPLKNVPHESEVITYCACPNDEASIRAAQTLLGAGFTRVRVLKGGWQNWLKVNGQVEPKRN